LKVAQSLISSFRELKVGVPVADENGIVYGNSVTAAQQGIAQVTLSRIFMACPGKLSS
jgi:Sideroflexins